ncbi:MAG: MBL fold metallo-hydrolase [Ruminococcaceae bacterium]|nr:MBL fold metallo-hydrolase [Oscillospiraceae bacterium]
MCIVLNILQLCLGPLHTNCYIVYGEDKKAAVIDPAFFADRIQRALDEKGLVLDKILLTHAHFDHIMAAEDLRKGGAKLYVHFEDEEMYSDPDLSCMYDFTGKSIRFDKADRLLRGGDTIDIGAEKLTVLHTPGHTKGSVCYISDDVIFSGDTLFCGGVGRCDLHGGSYETLLCSLKKLSELEKDYVVLPGHGEQTTLNKEKSDNIYMRTLR